MRVAAAFVALIAFAATPQAVAAPPSTVTSATMLTEGEYIGGSTQRMYFTGNAQVSVAGVEGGGGGTGGIYVDLSGGTHGDYFDMRFLAPQGEPFIPGHYDGAQRASFREAGRPGIDVSGSGRGCNRIEGRFDIRDIAFNEAGDLSRLWLVYEQHCEGGQNALFGEVLYKMPRTDPALTHVQREVWWPDEDRGRKGAVVPVFVVNEGAEPQTLGASDIGGSAASEFSIRDDACQGQTLLEGELCKVWVRFEPVTSGPRIAHLALRAGGAVFARTTLSGTGTPGVSGFSATSASNGPTNGVTHSFDTSNATVSANASRRYFSATVTPDSGGSYQATFDSGISDVLGSGRTYAPAGSSAGTSPSLEISGTGIACSPRGGAFTIDHIAYTADDRLKSANISYSQNCDGHASPVTGRVRFRAPGIDTIPPAPPAGAAIARTGGNALVSWSNPGDADLREVIVRYAETASVGAKHPLSLRHGYAGSSGQVALPVDPDRDLTVVLHAVDRAGNISVPRVVTDPGSGTNPDPGPPDTVLETSPPVRSSSDTGEFEFSSSRSGSTFECSLDSAPFVSCESPLTLSDLSDGNHRFEVRARNGEEVDLTPAAFAWNVDTVRPGTMISNAPPTLTDQTHAEFTFTSDESEASFECSLDGAAFQGCSSPLFYSSLSDGTHELRVRAKDATGNLDLTPVSHTWTVDTVAPSTELLSYPPEQTTQTDAGFRFSADESAATFECRLDLAQWQPCESPVTYSGLTVGPHAFEVRASDPLGNAENPPVSHSWNVVGETGCEGTDTCAISRELLLRYKERADKFAGRVQSTDPDCIGPAVEVTITRLGANEKVVWTGFTNNLGKFSAEARIRRGARYVASVTEESVPGGVCTAAESAVVEP